MENYIFDDGNIYRQIVVRIDFRIISMGLMLDDTMRWKNCIVYNLRQKTINALTYVRCRQLERFHTMTILIRQTPSEHVSSVACSSVPIENYYGENPSKLDLHYDLRMPIVNVNKIVRICFGLVRMLIQYNK